MLTDAPTWILIIVYGGAVATALGAIGAFMRTFWQRVGAPFIAEWRAARQLIIEQLGPNDGASLVDKVGKVIEDTAIVKEETKRLATTLSERQGLFDGLVKTVDGIDVRLARFEKRTLDS